jgi:hypothetical protein
LEDIILKQCVSTPIVFVRRNAGISGGGRPFVKPQTSYNLQERERRSSEGAVVSRTMETESPRR